MNQIKNAQKWLFDGDELFACLPECTQQSIASNVVKKTYQRGDTVYQLGDPAGGLYYVVDGGLRLEIGTVNNDMALAHFLPPRVWFGEGPALTGQSRLVGVRAVKPTILRYLSLSKLNQLAANDPHIYRHIARILQSSLRVSINAIADLMIREVDKRFAATLLRLSGLSQSKASDERIVVYFSQEELAGMANVTRSTANNILKMLSEKKLISVRYRQIIIENAEGLQQFIASETKQYNQMNVTNQAIKLNW